MSRRRDPGKAFLAALRARDPELATRHEAEQEGQRRAVDGYLEDARRAERAAGTADGNDEPAPVDLTDLE